MSTVCDAPGCRARRRREPFVTWPLAEGNGGWERNRNGQTWCPLHAGRSRSLLARFRSRWGWP